MPFADQHNEDAKGVLRYPQVPLPRNRARLRLFALTGLGVSYAGFAAMMHARPGPIFCPFRLLTGKRCPLCGFTTATGHLLNGEWRLALRAHFFAPVIWLAVGIWSISAFTNLVSRGHTLNNESRFTLGNFYDESPS